MPADDQLLETRDHYRNFLDWIPQTAWLGTRVGPMEHLNSGGRGYFGLSLQQATQQNWSLLVHPEDREICQETWKAAAASQQTVEFTCRLRAKSGEYRWHRIRSAAIGDSADFPGAWLATASEIHDQHEAENRLRAEHRQKDQLLGLLAHELRNPLTPLGNAVEVLAAARPNTGLVSDLIPIMKRQLTQLTRLIDELLDFSRMIQRRLTLRCERTNATAVAAAAGDAVRPWLSEFPHQLTAALPNEQLWIDADATRLNQVLQYLLLNAAKNTEPPGQIHLSVMSSDDEVHFCVRDNGQGFSQSMSAQIFEPFVESDSQSDAARGSVGIRLALVRQLVELHGGRVSAHSKGLGQGSEFIVRIPRLAAAECAPTSATKQAVELVAPNRQRILVVDDVPASAKTLSLMLSALDQSVEMAFDGRSAISKLSENRFDIVFLDIAMPGMDGLETVRRLRSDSALSNLILVALTGFDQDEDRQRSLEAGFHAHLVKPVSLNQLQDVLRLASMRTESSPN